MGPTFLLLLLVAPYLRVLFVLLPRLASLIVVGGTALLLQGLATGWPVNHPSTLALVGAILLWSPLALWIIGRGLSHARKRRSWGTAQLRGRGGPP
ncbi:MAG TPA: hypothetical protein VE985_11280 [Gaiellaceae bacterium]|nr:hypothetical protein [Gaiellaceae bacterium]